MTIPFYVSIFAFRMNVHFSLMEKVNCHNYQCWSNEKPKQFHTQRTQTLKVWVGISGNDLFGSHKSKKYRNNPKLGIVWAKIRSCFSKTDFTLRFAFTKYLVETFSGRWIGRRSALDLPIYLPDFHPLDSFLWGHL